MMKQLIIIFLLSAFTTCAQSNYESDLLKALDTYDKAEDFEGVLLAAEQAQEVSDAHLEEWLPAYWTSFIYSQAGRLSKDKLKYYGMADDYLTRTSANISVTGKDQQVYVYALSSLLATLSQGPYFAKGDIEKGTALVKQQNESIAQGLAIQSDSPLLHVLLGTNTLSEGFRAKPAPDISKLVMGKALLEQAKESFKASVSNNPLTPDRWNEPWIEVWLNRLNKN